MNHLIDLRSDTVTRPGPAMRAAMAAAEVGDDVYGDDPSVNRLQHVTAELFGYEAALFAPSGTQSNLIGLMAHCGRGDEYLVGQEAHTYKYEAGGAAVLGSIQPQPLPQQADGSLALADIAGAIKPDDVHFARTRLLALENTIGGRVLPRDYLDAATTLAHQRGLIEELRVFRAQPARQGFHLRGIPKGIIDTARHHLLHRHPMEQRQQVRQDHAVIRRKIGNTIDLGQQRGPVVLHQRIHQVLDITLINRAQHVADITAAERLIAEGNGLVCQAQGVPHTAIRGTCQ